MKIDAPRLTGKDAVAITADLLLHKRKNLVGEYLAESEEEAEKLRNTPIEVGILDVAQIQAMTVSFGYGIRLPSGIMLWGDKTAGNGYSICNFRHFVDRSDSWLYDDRSYKPIGYEE